jgi:thioesterase DpgC
MSAEQLRARIDRWVRGEPAGRGEFGADLRALADFTAEGDELLAVLPDKAGRDEPLNLLAARIHECCRRVRNRAALRHAVALYDELTDGRTRFHRLPELAFAAAERFPGLVPTRAQLDAERDHGLAHREGREIDQGIFFRGLLRSPAAGAHLADAMLRPSPGALALLGEFRDTGRADLDTVLLERNGRAAYLTVHNVHCLNAEDNRLIADLETAVDLALLDDQVGVGVLRGGFMTHSRYRGRRVFSAGINLVDLAAGAISFVDFLLGRELGYLSKLAHGLLVDPDAGAWPWRTTHKPWVAAVDSFAIGGGMQLLLVVDRVIAADDAYFSLPAAREGIVPGVANLRLGRLAGGRLSRRILLSGQRVRATDPEAALLCDEVLPGAGVDAAVRRAVEELDHAAVVANRRMLSLAEEPPERLRAYLAEFAVVQARRLYSPDVIARLARWRTVAVSG